jgi:hypothetical protein
MKIITNPRPVRSKNILGVLSCAFLMKFVTRYLVLAILVISSSAVAQEKAPPPADQGGGNTAQAMVAQQSAASTQELQKAVQNPIASLISVPFQNNDAFGIGPYDRTQNLLNIQPVIPIGISENWNLITRIIQPILWQPYPNAPTGGTFGFGDMVPSFFFSPKNSGKLIWGAGPQFILPTATDHILGQGKVSMGPTVVALIEPKTGAIGVLVSNDWSIAGSGSRPDVNQMTLQYFANYNLQKGWYFSSSPILTANWKARNGNVWVVPFGGGGGRVMKFGSQPVNLNLQFFGNAVHPAGASSWGMRFQIALLYPKMQKP